MKILIVHQYYLRAGQPGGSRFNEMARLWREAGHEVTVIAGTLNYVTGDVLERWRWRWVTKEIEEGVTVWRCCVPPTYNRSYFGRMWAFFGFTLSAATAALLAGRPDIVIATSPPLIAVIPGWLAARARFHRAPWVFEIRDLWPESAITTGVLKRDSGVARLLYGLERWACCKADAINVLTPAFKEDIVTRGLVKPERVMFVPNGADLALFRPGPRDNDVRRSCGWGDRFVALYAGAHGRANAIGQLVDAAGQLRDRRDILIATIGDGPERQRWEREAAERGLDNIVFLGAQPKSAMGAFINAADVGVAVLQNNETFRGVYPNKLFDYMACQRAIVSSVDGVARRLVCDEAKAGVFAEPESGAALARAIRRLADDAVERETMAKNGREWVLAFASREVLARRYIEHLEAIVAKASGRAIQEEQWRAAGDAAAPEAADGRMRSVP